MLQGAWKSTWVSPSSISSYLSCPKAYFLQNVYKNERGKKISIVSPASSVGSLIHEVVEPYALLTDEERKNKMFGPAFYKGWENISGEKGGFSSVDEEEKWKEKAINILRNIRSNIHHLLGETAFLLPDPKDLPSFFLNKEEDVVLCGKLDFLFKSDHYKILDIKTGDREEKENSLQLPIYSLLIDYYGDKIPSIAQYWYVGRDPNPVGKKLPSLKESYDKVMEVALRMKESRAKKEFICPRGGCWSCTPLEKIIKGEAKFVGEGLYKAECYKI